MDARLKVLFLDDSAQDTALEVEALRRHGLACEAHRAASPREFREEMEAFRPDLVIAEAFLNQCDPEAALQFVHATRPDVPFFFVSNTPKWKVRFKEFAPGAAGYLCKSELARLGPTVQRTLQEAGI